MKKKFKQAKFEIGCPILCWVVFLMNGFGVKLSYLKVFFLWKRYIFSQVFEKETFFVGIYYFLLACSDFLSLSCLASD